MCVRDVLQAVLQLNWAAGGDNIWTASADKSVGFWDAMTGQRVRKMADHSNIVNAGALAAAASVKGARAQHDTLQLRSERQHARRTHGRQRV